MSAFEEVGMKPIEKMVLTLTLPESADDVGRWLEANGGAIEISCMLGRYDVTVTWSVVRSYSDNYGEHRECWRVSRRGDNLSETMRAALEAAVARQRSR